MLQPSKDLLRGRKAEDAARRTSSTDGLSPFDIGMRRTSAAERICLKMFSGTTKPQREGAADGDRFVRPLLMFCILCFQDGL